MKRLPPFVRLALCAAAFAPLTALAHPGHEGDHDLVWDFDHLAAHPAATLLCGVVLGVIVWAGWRLMRPAHKDTSKVGPDKR